MTAPKLATSRPAALTGTVGQGGVNRIHDVALVQALLGTKRDRKSNRPYLRDHVTGKYDGATAEALVRYRIDQRDTNIKRPFQPRGSMLSKLAQGQSLAVAEGTAIPYRLALPAEPGPIKGPFADLLSAERKAALHEVMKAIAKDRHIALNVEVRMATTNAPPRTRDLLGDYVSLPLVAHFTARNLSVIGTTGMAQVPTNEQFRARAKALYEIVETDLKARCLQAFGISDPVDVKVQNGLKDDLACVVRTDLEGVEALAQFYLADFRKKGFALAVQFLENYLKANPDEISLGRADALVFEDVLNAVAVNIERFWQDNLIEPKSKEPGVNDAVEAITKNPEVKKQSFEDHWVRSIPSTALWTRIKSKLGADVDPLSGSFAFGAGGGNLNSTGKFELQRKGDLILVEVKITHVWSDDGYDFNEGDPFHDESQVLERHKKAKPFKWKAEWQEVLKGEILIVDSYSANPSRRGLRFEVTPAS
jgi:hypothetical protein